MMGLVADDQLKHWWIYGPPAMVVLILSGGQRVPCTTSTTVSMNPIGMSVRHAWHSRYGSCLPTTMWYVSSRTSEQAHAHSHTAVARNNQKVFPANRKSSVANFRSIGVVVIQRYWWRIYRQSMWKSLLFCYEWLIRKLHLTACCFPILIRFYCHLILFISSQALAWPKTSAHNAWNQIFAMKITHHAIYFQTSRSWTGHHCVNEM